MKLLHGIVLVSLILAVGIVPGAPPVLAQQEEKARVSIDVKDTDIKRVLEAFGQQTGLNMVIGKEVTGTVSVRLKLPRGRVLEGPLLANFEQERERIDAMMTRAGSRMAQTGQPTAR